MIGSLVPCDVADPTLPIAGLVLVWAITVVWHRRSAWRAAPLVVGAAVTAVVLAALWIALRAPAGCPAP